MDSLVERTCQVEYSDGKFCGKPAFDRYGDYGLWMCLEHWAKWEQIDTKGVAARDAYMASVANRASHE
jgi:hypothetical protein